MAECLDSYSWYSLKGLGSIAPDLFHVGDFKNEVLRDGTPVQFRLIGFRHDISSRDRKPLMTTWEMVDCMPNRYPWYRDEVPDDIDWGECYLHHIMNDPDGEVYNLMPSGIIDVAEPVIKLTNRFVHGEWELSESVDTFFIKSAQETWGRKMYAREGEGRWYEFYRQENTPWGKTRNGDSEWTMLRSPYYNGANAFCYVNAGGNASTSTSRYSYGLAPAFSF